MSTPKVQETEIYSWRPTFFDELSDQKKFVAAPDTSSWQFENFDIQSKWVKGGKVEVNLKARLDSLSPKQMFTILTHPGNCEIFRANKPNTIRKIISREQDGTQVVEVIQNMGWRTQHMIVHENERDLTINFKLAKKGFMRVFEGSWNFQQMQDEQQKELKGTYVTLDQFVLTANLMPGVMRKIVPGIGAKHVRHMVEDLHVLQRRIGSGETLDSILEKGMQQHEKEFDMDDTIENYNS
eukprot:TRINITY_DN37885_c0_g1_i1.p2 TRINITY_DN37885_c0_g1~~TRINITY_DN37885_c0_g1_i1.p2  ORF type:complete len:239 (-),score=41.34 TRINITY_DN37885_c0_g1_i1:364-1080(-)